MLQRLYITLLISTELQIQKTFSLKQMENSKDLLNRFLLSFILLSPYETTFDKKSSNIPIGKSEFVYRRRTDTTMVKRTSTKGQTTESAWRVRQKRVNQPSVAVKLRLLFFVIYKRCFQRAWSGVLSRYATHFDPAVILSFL